MSPGIRLLLRWGLNAVALLILPEVLSGITVESYVSALAAALLLGLVNALIRPILILITLPITLLTLGLFTLVINAFLFWGVSGLIGGIQVSDFWTAFWGALLYSILTWAVNVAVGDPDRRIRIVVDRR